MPGSGEGDIASFRLTNILVFNSSVIRLRSSSPTTSVPPHLHLPSPISDKTAFPNIFRTSSPSTINVVVFARLCAELGLKNVGIVVNKIGKDAVFATVNAVFADLVTATDGMQLAFNDKIEVRGETLWRRQHSNEHVVFY